MRRVAAAVGLTVLTDHQARTVQADRLSPRRESSGQIEIGIQRLPLAESQLRSCPDWDRYVGQGGGLAPFVVRWATTEL